MINGMGRRSLLDIKVRKGADVGSDHHFVTTALKPKLCKTRFSQNGRQRFHMEQQRDIKLKRDFILQPEEKFSSARRGWRPNTTRIKTSYQQTCKTCLGTKQRKKEWITEDTWHAIENRRFLKKKVMEAKSEQLKERDNREAKRTVKRMTRTDKRNHIDNLASQAEDATSRGEQSRVSKITKLVCSRYRRSTDTTIMDKQGQVLTTEAEQDARWTEHFSEVLNRPPTPAEADIQEAEADLDVNTDTPQEKKRS